MPKYEPAQCRFDVDRTFMHHAPKDDQAARYTANRNAAREFAALLAGNCPPSPELTLALRNVQEAMMFANAAIAIHE